jgi:hypothetical protein
MLPDSPGDAQRELLIMAEGHHAGLSADGAAAVGSRSARLRAAGRRRSLSA